MTLDNTFKRPIDPPSSVIPEQFRSGIRITPTEEEIERGAKQEISNDPLVPYFGRVMEAVGDIDELGRIGEKISAALTKLEEIGDELDDLAEIFGLEAHMDGSQWLSTLVDKKLYEDDTRKIRELTAQEEGYEVPRIEYAGVLLSAAESICGAATYKNFEEFFELFENYRKDGRVITLDQAQKNIENEFSVTTVKHEKNPKYAK